MKNLIVYLIIGLTIVSCSMTSSDINQTKLIGELDHQLKYLVDGVSSIDSIRDIPRSYFKDSGYELVDQGDWTSGFPAGTFWYMYELTGDEYWKSVATKYTVRLEKIQFQRGTHDLGFMAGCSYGNGYRITKDPSYKEALLNTAETLSERFNPTVGCIRSWDFGHWQFPVIIDNMMNLELMFWASKEGGNPKYRGIAISHANKTLENHYRDDMSSYHLVDYDTITGLAIGHQTHQGYQDETSWSRGQSWGLYGFTVCYRETGDPKYLDAAKKIAAYIKSNLPEDMVPYWDYFAPEIPNEPKDASAAALIASALYELCALDSMNSDNYKETADKIVASLSSDKYRVSDGSNGGFLLLHSVGSKPHNMEVDAPLNYADYYYVEALYRKINLEK